MSDNLKAYIPTEEVQQQTRQVLGEKYAFSHLVLYHDKNEELTSEQFKQMRALGWEPDGPACFVYQRRQ